VRHFCGPLRHIPYQNVRFDEPFTLMKAILSLAQVVFEFWLKNRLFAWVDHSKCAASGSKGFKMGRGTILTHFMAKTDCKAKCGTEPGMWMRYVLEPNPG
jgi:hypothetical protein